MKECEVNGCNLQARARGWCSLHYQRWRAHGDPEWALPTVCTVAGCGTGGKITRGYCIKHYARFKKRGDPLDPGSRIIGNTEARFWSKVNKTASCWLWTGGTYSNGYGKFAVGRKRPGPHVYSFVLHGGVIPTGHVVDHICMTPLCVRPDHLHAVTRKGNNEHMSGAQRNSKSGIRGVIYDDRFRRPWIATAKSGDLKYVERFATCEEAEVAVSRWRAKHMTNSLKDQITSVGCGSGPTSGSPCRTESEGSGRPTA